ncbi:MAG: cupin domain-containing protein [Candidatus Nealsonbacteria bacterium]
MFYRGNYKIESKEKGGWFVGHFMDNLRRSEDLEIKYWEFGPGPTNHKKKRQKQSWEITLILRGKIDGEIEGEKVKLEAGDYVIIPPRVENGFPVHVLDYVEGITIKFPSLPNDKEEK